MAAAVDLHNLIISQEPRLQASPDGQTSAESEHRSSSRSHVRQLSSTSSTVSQVHPTEPLLGRSIAFEDLLDRQPLHPAEQQHRDSAVSRDMGLTLQGDTVSEREWVDVWENDVRKRLRRLWAIQVVFSIIISIWAVYTAVRYFVAYVLYDDPVRRRLSLSLGICCLLSLFFTLLIALSSLIPADLRPRLPFRAYTRTTLPYLASSLQTGPAVVNLVFVVIWRYTQLVGRCHWDVDVVWQGEPNVCDGGIPWRVWLGGAIARLVITILILALYHIADHVHRSALRSSSAFLSGLQTPNESSVLGKSSFVPSVYTASSSVSPPAQTRSFFDRFWRNSSETAADIENPQGKPSTSASSPGVPLQMAEAHRGNSSSSQTAVDHRSVLRQSHGSSHSAAIPPPAIDITENGSWVSLSLRPVRPRQVIENRRSSSGSRSLPSAPSSSGHSPSTQTPAPIPDSQQHSPSGGSGGASSPSSRPLNAEPGASSSRPGISEEDLARFAEQFRALVGQLTFDVQNGMQLDSDTSDSEPATPPLHNVLDTHTSYMTMDEFGRPVPSDARIPILGRYIRRMPTIESMASRESAALRGSTVNTPTHSRPPTRATMRSFAASMSDHFPSAPPSRSNSLNQPSGSNNGHPPGNGAHSGSPTTSPIRARASSTSDTVDLSRDGSGASTSNQSSVSKSSSAKTSSSQGGSLHAAAGIGPSGGRMSGSEGIARSRSGSLPAVGMDTLSPVAESGETSAAVTPEAGQILVGPLNTSPTRTISSLSSSFYSAGSYVASNLSPSEPELEYSSPTPGGSEVFHQRGQEGGQRDTFGR